MALRHLRVLGAATLFALGTALAGACSAGGDGPDPGGENSGGAGSGGWGSSSSTASTGGGMPDAGCSCDGLACGLNACGQSCGQCAANEMCAEGQCVCVPDCAGKTCGSDGCGSTCGTCSAQEICDTGACVPKPPGPMPDLRAGYFYIDAHSAAPGQGSTVHLSIENKGTADTTDFFKVVVSLSKNDILGDADDVPVWTWDYPYITEAGQHYLWQKPVTIPIGIYNGSYFIGIHVDAGGDINESDESNNVLFDPQKVTIFGNPNVDLHPSAPMALESSVYPGQMAVYTFNVDNLGPDASGSYKVGLYYSTDANVTIGDTLICTYSDASGVPGLATKMIQTTCPVPNLNGSYYFGVVADPGSLVKEVDETNNTAAAAQPVNVAPLDIDLQMGTITTNDVTVDTGQQVTLAAAITNAGTSTAPPFKVAFYYSKDATITTGDTFICEVSSGQSLPPNQPLTVQTTCAVPLLATGSYSLGAIVDPLGELQETNEMNNTGSSGTAVSIKAPNMDLEYYLLWDNVSVKNPGESVTYHLQVRNQGTAPTPGFVASVHYSLDGNITVSDPSDCTVQLTGVPAMTITEYTFVCNVPLVPPGYYSQGTLIDPNNEIPEIDETNNIGYDGTSELIQ